MGKLRALDLFCCAGGASMGLTHAGFDVTCVDIEFQPNHPFEFPGLPFGRFIKADALTFDLRGFDFVWASPPCQSYSTLNAYNKKKYPDLISDVRAKLRASRIPYVIENVMGAPLIDPILLCGPMFGLKVYRHRGFEASFKIPEIEHERHTLLCSRNGYLPTPERPFMSVHGGKHSKKWIERAAVEMGTPWMKTVHEVCEAIPPAYAEYIGRAAIAHINSLRAEAA